MIGRKLLYDEEDVSRHPENTFSDSMWTSNRPEDNYITSSQLLTSLPEPLPGGTTSSTVSEELGTSFESSASFLMTESVLARTLEAEERRLRGMSLDEERTKSPSNSSYGGSASSSVLQRLDAGAVAALSELDPQEAEAIAVRLEQAGPSVRNPSAYVHRAVNNAKRRAAEPRPPSTRRSSQQQQQQQQHQQLGLGYSLRKRLDASAIAALAELPPENAQAILDELASKGTGKVRNPSAYVVKAVGNARRGGSIQSQAQQQHPTPHRPDRRYTNRIAQAASSSTHTNLLGPPGSTSTTNTAASSTNTQRSHYNLSSQANTTNSSIYNQQQNSLQKQLTTTKIPTTSSMAAASSHGDTRFIMQQQSSQLDSSAFDTARAWADSSARGLDSKAATALLALPPERAVQILTELKRKRATIRNPSAYVTRATTNALSGHQHNPSGNQSTQEQQHLQQQHLSVDTRKQQSSLLLDPDHCWHTTNPTTSNDISIAPAPSAAALFAGAGPRRLQLEGIDEAQVSNQSAMISQSSNTIPRLQISTHDDTNNFKKTVASPPRTAAVGRQATSASLSLSSAPLIFDFGPDLSIAPTTSQLG